MPRRRELKSIASGLARHCVSRNNDISGYWGVGILHRLAQKRACESISISVMESSEPLCPELRSFKTSFLERFQAARHGLLEVVEDCEVEFRFEPHAWLEGRGQYARVTCTVHLIDDLGKRRTASASTYCYPHDPRFESRSARAHQPRGE
jgi:hypothetical protein